MKLNTQLQNPVVIYDGECHFCIEQIERIQRLDKHRVFEYVPRQNPETEERFPVLTSVDFDKGMRLIMPDGKLYSGMDALHQIGLRLPLVQCVAWLYSVPVLKQIAQLGYAWVAANRKRLGKTCDDGACKVHSGPNDLADRSQSEPESRSSLARDEGLTR